MDDREIISVLREVRELIALDCAKFEESYAQLLKRFHLTHGREKQQLRLTLQKMKEKLESECQQSKSKGIFIYDRDYDPDYFESYGAVAFSILRDGEVLHEKNTTHGWMKVSYSDRIYQGIKDERLEKEYRKQGVRSYDQWKKKVGRDVAKDFLSVLVEEHEKVEDKLFAGSVDGRMAEIDGERIVSFWNENSSKPRMKQLASKLPFKWDKIAVWAR